MKLFVWRHTGELRCGFTQMGKTGQVPGWRNAGVERSRVVKEAAQRSVSTETRDARR